MLASLIAPSSQMIYAAVTISTDGTFVASTGQILGLYVGVTVAIGILNSLPTKWLHRIIKFYGALPSCFLCIQTGRE